MYARKGSTLNIREVAQLLGVCEAQVRIMVKRGDLIRTQKGNHFVIPYLSLQLYLEKEIQALIQTRKAVLDASAKAEKPAEHNH